MTNNWLQFMHWVTNHGYDITINVGVKQTTDALIPTVHLTRTWDMTHFLVTLLPLHLLSLVGLANVRVGIIQVRS